MDWLNKAVGSGVLRQLIQSLGTAGVTAGLYTAEQNVVIAGAVAMLIGVAAEIITAQAKRRQIKELENK